MRMTSRIAYAQRAIRLHHISREQGQAFRTLATAARLDASTTVHYHAVTSSQTAAFPLVAVVCKLRTRQAPSCALPFQTQIRNGSRLPALRPLSEV